MSHRSGMGCSPIRNLGGSAPQGKPGWHTGHFLAWKLGDEACATLNSGRCAEYRPFGEVFAEDLDSDG